MPFVTIKRRRSFLGLLVPEWLVAVFAAAASLLYFVLDLTPRAPLLLFSERIQGAIPSYGLALIVALAYVRLRHVAEGRRRGQFVPHRASWEAFRELFLTRGAVTADLRLIVSTCVMFVVFVNLKHLIPHVNPLLLDSFFFRFEQTLLGGGEIASQLLIRALGTAHAALLSDGYTLFYPYLLLLIYIFIMQRNRDLALQFLSAFFLLWFLGILVVYCVPTWGPCFYAPALFRDLPATEVTAMQEKLWRHKQWLDHLPDRQGVAYLISGFPSLHFAVTLLGTYYLRWVHPVLSVLSGVFAAVTFVTTLYFGWHYVLDLVGSVLLVLVVIRAARRYFAVYQLYVNN